MQHKVSLLDWTSRMNRVLQSVEAALGMICLFVMFAVMLINIVSRYLLYKPIPWSDELCNYLFIWMSFLASAYVMGNDGHVRVTAIQSMLPPKIGSMVHLVLEVVMVVMLSLYIGPSFRMLGKLRLSNMMQVPLKFVYAIMPICFSLMCIHILINIIKDVHRLQAVRAKTGVTNTFSKSQDISCC